MYSSSFSRAGLIPAGAGQTTFHWAAFHCPWAHPRGCGADVICQRMMWPCPGSSPRVRGRPLRSVGHECRVRLIPAGARQTAVWYFSSAAARAHPRGCGADGRPFSSCARHWGSSPRVRGRHSARHADSGVIGLIPAGAGQTWTMFATVAVTRAHPRGCGADCMINLLCSGLGGLIPAGAGQTVRGGSGEGKVWAHPRGCGADFHRMLWTIDDLGSSPRVRGRPVVGRARRAGAGLIPAGAGQTPKAQESATHRGAHPRGCGADRSSHLRECAFHGSSPQVRGRPDGVLREKAVERLIPAGAGQTTHHPGRGTSAGAHLRGCGADVMTTLSSPKMEGSSPRVRGRLSRRIVGWRKPGLIPAGAGQTSSHSAHGSSLTAHPRGCGADMCVAGEARAPQGSSPRVRGRLHHHYPR